MPFFWHAVYGNAAAVRAAVARVDNYEGLDRADRSGSGHAEGIPMRAPAESRRRACRHHNSDQSAADICKFKHIFHSNYSFLYSIFSAAGK